MSEVDVAAGCVSEVFALKAPHGRSHFFSPRLSLFWLLDEEAEEEEEDDDDDDGAKLPPLLWSDSRPARRSLSVRAASCSDSHSPNSTARL